MNQISDELIALNSSLAHISSNPYSVPKGYFETFPATMLARVTQDITVQKELELLSPLLAGLSQITPYTVPANYFGTNLVNLSFVYGEPATPVLDLVDRKTPYEVPVGYFASMEADLTEKISQPRAKVFSIATRWMRMAAAAMLIGVIGLAGYNYFQESDNRLALNQSDSTQQQTAALQRSGAQVEAELKNMSVTTLDAFITNMDAASTATATKKTSAVRDLKEQLKDIPVDDLDLFLEQVPTGRDDLSLID